MAGSTPLLWPPSPSLELFEGLFILMKMADLTFTTIEESARHFLSISRDEYAACNYIQTWASHPSNNTPGFCNRTRGQMALFIGISERGMQKMLTRLEGMDLIKRASQKQFVYRITEKWFDVVVQAKEQRTGEQSSRQGVNKVPAHKEYNNELIMSGEKSRLAPARAENQTPLKEKTEQEREVPPGRAAAENEPSPKVAPKGSSISFGFCTTCQGRRTVIGRNGPVECLDCEGSGLGDGKVDLITLHDPELPGVTIVAPMPGQPTTLDAEKAIIDWCLGDGLETVKYRHETAGRNFEQKQVAQLAAHYVSIYASTNESSRARLMSDPVRHFQDGLYKYLKNETAFARNAPGHNGAVRGNGKANINRLGSDPSVYSQPQKF